MKLISMTEFVLSQESSPYISEAKYKDILAYAEFLKQPLTLGMFVPCDEDDNLLEEPDKDDDYYRDAMGLTAEFFLDLNLWKEAEKRVLFKDVSILRASKNTFNIYIKKQISVVYESDLKTFRASKTIEDLANNWNKVNLNEFFIELQLQPK